MSDDEILALATDPASLREEALPVLALELDRRGLSSHDILEYQHFTDEVRPGQMRGAPQYLAVEVLGCGTIAYGRCDFDRSGSFVTTKWLALFQVPLIPLNSVRVLRAGGRVMWLSLLYLPLFRLGGPEVLPTGSRVTMRSLMPWLILWTPYAVLTEGRPKLKQVLRVYGYLLGFPILFSIPGYLRLNTNVLPFILVGAYCCLPWFLRRIARARLKAAIRASGRESDSRTDAGGANANPRDTTA